MVKVRATTPLARVLIALIGLHSCALGALMLVVPHLMLDLLGFKETSPLFFASQSGIFLLILGILYLLALFEPAFVWSILISKSFAVPFLVVHALFLSAPPLIWAAAAGDFTMLVAMVLVLLWAARLPFQQAEAIKTK